MAHERSKSKKRKKARDEIVGDRGELSLNDSEPELEDDESKWKPLFSLGDDVPDPAMSDGAKEETAEFIKRLRRGQKISLPHSRPMPSIGKQCHELRIKEEDGNWRIFYRLDTDCVLLIHVLWKTTGQTPLSAIELCKKRLKRYKAACDEYERQNTMKERKARH